MRLKIRLRCYEVEACVCALLLHTPLLCRKWSALHSSRLQAAKLVLSDVETKLLPSAPFLSKILLNFCTSLSRSRSLSLSQYKVLKAARTFGSVLLAAVFPVMRLLSIIQTAVFECAYTKQIGILRGYDCFWKCLSGKNRVPIHPPPICSMLLVTKKGFKPSSLCNADRDQPM